MNPTGGKVRKNRWGDGSYGAGRDYNPSTGKFRRIHEGSDHVGMVGQWVVATAAGIVTGTGLCYGDGDDGPWNQYIKLSTPSGVQHHLFYCSPLPGIIGKDVVEGQVIGRLEDVSQRYRQRFPKRWKNKGAMKPHVHWRKLVGGEVVDPNV